MTTAEADIAIGVLTLWVGSDKQQSHTIMRRLLSASRFLIVLPAFGSFIAATTLLLYGAAETVQLVRETMILGVNSKGAKALTLAFIEVVDLFLLGTVLYIIALGLYELFIDDRLPLPDWLAIHDLDDLKNKLTGVVIVVMGVLFLGQVVTWDGERDLLRYGGAVASVIAALTYFLSQRVKKTKPDQSEPHG